MFQETRLKLTVWYLIIIMAISLLFSMVIYSLVVQEFSRFEKMQEKAQSNFPRHRLPPEFQQYLIQGQTSRDVINKAKVGLLINLGVLNFILLFGAGVASYFLSGKTLKPIKKSMEDQNRFISDSSHELRTPLTSLRTEIEITLRNKKLSLSEAKKTLNSNLEEVISLQNLSNNLLELAQNGKLINKNKMEDFDLLNSANEAIKKVNKFSKTKQIKIINSIEKQNISGIENRITEVFTILLDNAIKYSPKKSVIEISSKKSSDKIEVLIKDHGIGIDKVEINKIFDRFYRSDKSRNEEGFGLGLPIAKKIIEAHGGDITVKSDAKETVFKFTLHKS